MFDRNSRSARAVIVAAAAVTGLAVVAASYLPDVRLWGLSVWAYTSPWQRWLVWTALVVITWAWVMRSGRAHVDSAVTPPNPDARILPWEIGVTATLAGAIFWFFHTEVHLLGDGYLLLKSLASDYPLIRLRNYGEMLAHLGLRRVLPLDPAGAALVSFRSLSIAAGVLHVILILKLAPRIVGDRGLAWLFALGMSSGGWALLYFGYVENYTLFSFAVALYVYLGALVSIRRVHIGWLLPALALAVFCHALGVILVLPTLYLFWLRALPARRPRKRRRRAPLWIMTVLTATALGAALWAYAASQFIRFAFVPWPMEFRVLEGYSMFSFQHLGDVFNLYFLLFPGFLVLLGAVWRGNYRAALSDPRVRFLGITALATALAAFAFEAKIGMPRDWDLFSFVGIPWAACLMVAATVALDRLTAARALGTAILVAVACLGPRVHTARSQELAIRQFHDYAELDVRKNRSGWFTLGQYYLERGDSATYRSIRKTRAQRFPEETIVALADSAFAHERVDSAMRLDRMAIRLNPTYASGWGNLGACYSAKNQHDSAVWALERSDALNPDVGQTVSNLALMYFFAGRDKDAIQAFLKAHRLDPELLEPVKALARLYQTQGEQDKYVEWLAQAAYRKEADGIWASELGQVYLKRGDLANAGRAFSEALRKGSDSLRILGLLENHPDLRPHMQR
jgi:tetratricopeptide (TPR) repeat protein